MIRPRLACGPAALSVLLAACGGSSEAREPMAGEADVARAVAATRNVVVLLVDTLRADHLGCYGYHRDTSPHLDALARASVVFEDCLAQSSWTKPATGSVLTGELPSRHGATQPDARLSEEIETLAERLSERGVRTGAVIGNGWVSEEMGFARGFESFAVPTEKRAESLARLALEWIRAQGEEPFFLYLHLIDPHDPYAAPGDFETRFDPDYEGPVDGTEKEDELTALAGADLEHLIARYDGEIAYVDRVLGHFLAELARLGRAEDTAILFLADHGEEFLDHGSWRHNPRLFREVVRVPLVLRVPGADRLAGLRYPGLVQQVDVAPTVMHLLEVEPAAPMPGRSLLALLSDPDLRPRDALAISEVDFSAARTAVVGGGLKYVRQIAPRREEYLYDLRADPGETRNLLPEGAPVAARYADFLDAYARSVAAGFSVQVQNAGEERMPVRVFLGSEQGPPEDVRIFNGELGTDEMDGPVLHAEVEVGGAIQHVFSVDLTVLPRNSDGVTFSVPEGGEVRVAVQVAGRWAPAERYLLGPSLPAAAVPVRVTADQAELDAPRFPPLEDLGDEPYRVRIWRNLTARTDDGVISEETRAALRALGYLGGED